MQCILKDISKPWFNSDRNSPLLYHPIPFLAIDPRITPFSFYICCDIFGKLKIIMFKSLFDETCAK